jgi:hypothetical protein
MDFQLRQRWQIQRRRISLDSTPQWRAMSLNILVNTVMADGVLCGMGLVSIVVLYPVLHPDSAIRNIREPPSPS